MTGPGREAKERVPSAKMRFFRGGLLSFMLYACWATIIR